MTKKCDSCGRPAKKGFKFCWGCHKTTMAAMITSGYLTPVDWIKAEEKQRKSEGGDGLTEKTRKDHQKRIRSEAPARQVSGARMVSKKRK